jgi:choline dehydrogenase
MAVPNVNRPASRGEVRLDPADPLGAPVVAPRLLESPDDVRRMIAACRRIREVFAAPAFAAIVEGEIFPGPDVQTDAHWEEVLRQRVGPIYHVVGTCRMGADANAVVDAQLRVRGVRRLRVVDASVMPTITSGNTNAPTLMIAAKAADLILATPGA